MKQSRKKNNPAKGNRNRPFLSFGITSRRHICIIHLLRGEEREGRAEKIFQEIMAKIFPKLRKTLNSHIQDHQISGAKSKKISHAHKTHCVSGRPCQVPVMKVMALQDLPQLSSQHHTILRMAPSW